MLFRSLPYDTASALASATILMSKPTDLFNNARNSNRTLAVLGLAICSDWVANCSPCLSRFQARRCFVHVGVRCESIGWRDRGPCRLPTHGAFHQASSLKHRVWPDRVPQGSANEAVPIFGQLAFDGFAVLVAPVAWRTLQFCSRAQGMPRRPLSRLPGF